VGDCLRPSPLDGRRRAVRRHLRYAGHHRGPERCEARALGIIENKGRDNPSAIEEAKGAADLLRFNAGDKEKTANQLGWRLRELDNRLLLLNCATEVQRAIIERHPHMSIGHAELLAGLPQDRQVKVLAGILQHKVPVEVLKKQLGQYAKRLSEAIFDTAQCLGCSHNSAQQAALFDASIGEGYCQHPTHYDELTMAALEARAEPLRERFQVIRFVKPEDGFVPLAVAADGPLGCGHGADGGLQGLRELRLQRVGHPGSLRRGRRVAVLRRRVQQHEGGRAAQGRASSEQADLRRQKDGKGCRLDGKTTSAARQQGSAAESRRSRATKCRAR
jgi:ParB family chromosome partitioning protein